MTSRHLADALLTPRTIALVGASGDPAKNSARPQRYLRKHGFTGRVIPINSGREEVFGERAWPDLASAPGPIDHTFIMVPAASVPAVIEDCCRARVRVATIFSDDFAESGEEGLRRQQAIVEMARAGGVRILGPNSMGVINTHAAVAISVNAVLELSKLKAGSLSIVSHSGTILGTVLSRGQARGIGFSKLVSIGNEADLSVGEIADILVDDPETASILLFLETIRDPAGLGAMARRAYAADKPVIVYKLGRSRAGRQLAVSHSGAIVGPDEATNAFFHYHGMIRVAMLETMFEVPALITGHKPAKGKRVAVMTTTGGGAAMVVDRLGAIGVDLVSPPESVIASLEPLGIRVGKAPLIDLTLAGTKKEIYLTVLNTLLASPDYDAVVAVVGSSGQFHPELAVEPIVSAVKVDKPVAVFIAPQADRSLALLGEAGIAAFRTPEACADGVKAYLDWSPPSEDIPGSERVLTAVESELISAKGAVLNEMEACDVFNALGILQVPAKIVRQQEESPGLDFPVAAKILSPDIPHKTDVGGVELDIPDDAALHEACKRILHRVRTALPTAEIVGIRVQEMQHGLAEALIGYRDNPETGPTVMLGVGGTLAEIHRDVAIRIAPVSLATARAMIEEVPGLATIRGTRSLPPGDCEALAEAIRALSDLACIAGRPILEAEINPLIVKARGEGVAAVDGLVVRRSEKGSTASGLGTKGDVTPA
ncbi:MAG: acetate--CoA ligase family protein [Anaerolineae bacterium]